MPVAEAATTPNPTPTPAAQLAALPTRIETEGEIKAEIIRVFGRYARNALCIAQHESGFVPSKIGWNRDALHTHDRGVFQLNSYWHREVLDAEAFDAAANIAAAYRISQGGTNWHAWTTHTICGL